MKFKKVRAGWYETGNETEGAYVIMRNDSLRGSWHVSRWNKVSYYGGEVEHLELQHVESSGTLERAKFLAEFDARIR